MTANTQNPASSPGSEQNAFLAQFIATARRSHPGFSLLPFDTAHILTLEPLLKKIPNAIEAIAQLILFMNARDVCGAILKDPELLADLAEKGVASDIALELVWNFLSNEKKSTLLRLSVFPTTFSRDSAEDAATVAFSQLVQLASKSMLLRKGPARYEINNLLRSFLDRKLEAQPGLAKTSRQAHAKHFLAKLLELSQLDANNEDDNKKLKAMAGHALDLTQACAMAFPSLGPDAADAYLAALNKVLRQMGCYQELAVFLEATTKAFKASGAKRETPTELRLWARLTGCLGGAELHLGRPIDSLLRLLTAAREARALNQEALRQDVLEDLVIYATRYGRVTDIRPLFVERLADCKANQDVAGEAQTLFQLGRLEDLRGDATQVRLVIEPAMALFEKLGDRYRYDQCLGLMTERAMKDGHYAQAKEWGLKYLDRAGHAQERTDLVWSQQRVAEVELLTGALDSALTRLRQSLLLTNSLGEQFNWAYFHAKIGEALRLAGKLDESEQMLRTALESYQSMRNAWGEAWASDFLGFTLYLANHKDEAKILLLHAADALRQQQNASTLVHTLAHLGELRLDLEGPSAAWQDLREGLRLAIQGAYTHAQMDVMAVMAACLQKVGDPLGAELATYLPAQAAFTFGGRQVLQRWQVKPAAKLNALAGVRHRGLDLVSTQQLLLKKML